MKLAVIGAGAIGSALAARLAHAGQDVTLVVRKADRAKLIAAQGLACCEAGESLTGFPKLAPALPDERFDVVFLAVKADALPDLAQSLPASLGPDTLVVPLVNGIPWWFSLVEGSASAGIRAVDPLGALAARFCPEQIVGAVVYTTAMQRDPRKVEVMRGQSLVIGAVRPQAQARVENLADLLRAAGVAVEVSTSIADAVWNKVALNLATNPLSVVTGAGLGALCSDAQLVPIVSNILDETWRVASRLNARPCMTREEMLGKGRAAGAFRTSMLEDYLHGRPLELSAIADAVFELAGGMGLDLPVSRAVVDMARFQASRRSLATPSL